MPPNPEMRASDTERDRIAATMREHCAQGRLTIDELNERLDAVYAAKTIGDLQRLTADLPEEDMSGPLAPTGRSAAVRPRGHAMYHTGMRTVWGTYASVNLVCFTIWLISVVSSASWSYPWWVWVAGPWGAMVLAAQLFGPKGDQRGGR